MQVYVIGDVGILEELDLHGYQYFGGPEDGSKKVELSAGYAMPHDENVRPSCCGGARESLSSALDSPDK